MTHIHRLNLDQIRAIVRSVRDKERTVEELQACVCDDCQRALFVVRKEDAIHQMKEGMRELIRIEAVDSFDCMDFGHLMTRLEARDKKVGS